MIAGAADDWIYLRSSLEPLQFALARHDVTDIFVNRPGELWLETLGGGIERHDAAAMTSTTLMQLARQVAALNHQGISREHPLLSASLPDGSRIQVVAPPATRGALAIAIRKHVSADLTLDDYAASGALEDVRRESGLDPVLTAVSDHLRGGDTAAALRHAVRGRMNILVSGGTSSGKTTFLNALAREIPQGERLILIEDTPELALHHENAVGLLAARGQLGEAAVGANDLVSAALRMRPDRIILGELRGQEAFAFLRAINTGHPGSMTTIHANSVDGAVQQLALLVLEAGSTLRYDDIVAYVRTAVGMFIHLSRSATGRRIEQVVVRDD